MTIFFRKQHNLKTECLRILPKILVKKPVRVIVFLILYKCNLEIVHTDIKILIKNYLIIIDFFRQLFQLF